MNIILSISGKEFNRIVEALELSLPRHPGMREELCKLEMNLLKKLKAAKKKQCFTDAEIDMMAMGLGHLPHIENDPVTDKLINKVAAITNYA